MPELPEVETIKSQISDFLPLKVTKIEESIHLPSVLIHKDFSANKKIIQSIKRYGKQLIFEIENGLFIMSGLGMSGTWLISEKEIERKHTHIQFHCLNSSKKKYYLAYVDPRRFGKMKFLNKNNLEIQLERIGVDVSSKQFNLKYLKKVFTKFPNKKIKVFLLDQKYFAGVGNYIACEVCAIAGIHPERSCKSFTDDEVKLILKATKKVINQSIKNNGLTFSGGYIDAFGNKGMGVLNLVVFNQKICGLCKKGKVVKYELAQRGTYYCPCCQN